MYLSRSISKTETASQVEDGKKRLGPKALVSQCAFQKLLKISVAKRNGDRLSPHVRSFGELSELNNQ